MMSFSKLSIASLGAIALIGATSAPAMASPGTKAAVACQGGLQGCVLPVGNAAPAPAPAPQPVAAPVATPVAAPAEAASTGWILPALLAVAAAVGLYFLLDDNDDDDEPISV